MVQARLLSGALVPADLEGANGSADVRQRIASALSLPVEQVWLVGANGIAGPETQCSDLGAAESEITVYVGPDPLESQLSTMVDVANFDEFAGLSVLQLVGRNLTRLPERFAECRALQVLDLTGNRFETLPERFGNLVSLSDLCLQSNRLASLPRSFGQLCSLANLDLRDNRLSSLPEGFRELSSLRVLLLMYNPLQTFPESICKLPGLAKLNVGHAELPALPADIGRMMGLDNLNLVGNRLNELPETFGELAALRSLNLQDNPMTDALMDCHPARFTLAFLTCHGQLQSIRLWDQQDAAVPKCITKLALALDKYLEQDICGMPDCLRPLVALRRARLVEAD